MIRSQRMRKALRRLAIVLAVMFALVTLPLLALQFSAVRSLVLDEVLETITTSLPGQLRVGEAAWPQFSTLQFHDVDWVAEGDTLARVASFDLRWDSGALLRRHLHVPLLHLRVSRLDVPGLQSLLAAQRADSTAAAQDDADDSSGSGAVPWLREGSVRGLPSVWLEDLQIDLRQCRLGDSTHVDRLSLGARADLRRGRVPGAALEPLTLTMRGPDLEIVEGRVQIDLESGRLELTLRPAAASPWKLRANSDTSTPDVVSLQILAGPHDAELLTVLDASGTMQRSGSRVEAMRLQASLRTPDVATLRGIPLLQPGLAGVPDLEGLTIDVDGSIRWLPEWQVDLRTQVRPNAWLEGGDAHFVQRDDSLLVHDVSLRLAGLQLTGDWTQIGSAQEGNVHVEVDGSEWIAALAPETTVPDELDVDLRAHVTGSDATLGWQARLHAAVQQGSMRIDDLLAQAQSTSTPQDVRFHVQSRQQGWDVRIAGETVLGDSIRVSLDPIVVRQAGTAALEHRAEPLAPPSGPTRIVWHKRRGVRVEDLRVDGDLGRVRASARWSPSNDARLALTGEWPRPPAILLKRVFPDSLQRHRLIEGWPRGTTPALHVEALARPQAGGTNVTVSADLVVPGPRTFAFALPESIAVDDLDVLRVTLRADARQDSSLRWSARLDLSDTAWLDSTSVVAHAHADSFFVDSLRVLWDGLDVRLAGAADSARVALDGRMQWNAARWIERVPAARHAGVSLDAKAEWNIRGAPSAPDVDASLRAQVASHWGGVPGLEADVAVRQGVVETLDVVTPEGLRLREFTWDRLQLRLRPAGAGRDSLSRLRFDLEGAQQALHAALRLDLPQARFIQADSLSLRLFDRRLATTKPFRVHRTEQSLLLEDLDLQGSLGTLSADAFVGGDSLDVLALADLQLPEQPRFVRMPPGLWPTNLRLRAAAADNDSFSVFLDVAGLQLATRSQVSVLTRIHADRDSTLFTLDIADPEQRLLTSRGHLPLQWSLRPMHFALQEDSLSLHATFDEFPIPDVFEDPRTAIDYLARSRSSGGSMMHGSIDVDGRLTAPRVRTYLELQPQDPALREYSAHVFAALHQDDSRWGAALQKQLEGLSTAELLRAPGAKLAFWVERDSSRVLDAAAHMPVQLGFRDGRVHVDSDGRLRAALRSRTLQLDDFAPLLPPRTSLGGTLNIDLSADGDWKDPQLGGSVRFAELSVEMPDGSRVRATGKVEVQGNVSDPGVKGRVRVRDGLIRIPELPRSLLPTHGDALLLPDSTLARDVAKIRSNPPQGTQGTAAATATRAPSPVAAATDSTQQQRGDATAADSTWQALPRPPRVASNKEVFLEIPGAFWIRGRGFEVELSGQLQLTLHNGELRIVGELKAERGGLQLLASKFPIKSGRVLFYGDDETNPSLDLIMGRDYDGVTVEIVVQGTAKDPEIDFRSDPQLSEDEILSYVLFGRGTQQLDETQSSQFNDRALALASFLTTNLGEGIREQTGVDMIGLEQSAETADRASLVVGKYLSPRVLLKYVQDLERGRGYAVNVEYWLSGGLRLMTTSSRYDQSGLELNWSHDY